MTNHKTTYTLEINAEISALRNELENAKKAMKALDGSNFATGIEKRVGSMLTAIEKLQKKAGQPIDSKAVFTSLEKGFGSIVVDAKNLLGELEKIQTLTTKDKLSLLPENEAKKLKEAISAVQAYQKAVDRAERKRVRDLETAKIAKTDTQDKLSTAKKSASSAKTALENATKKGTQYGDALAIVQQAEAAKKAKKEITSLEKQLKKYREQLEELKKLENRTPEQENSLQAIRGNINSISGKIGNRTKIVNKAPDEKTLTAANKVIEENAPSIGVLEQAVTAADQEVNRLTNTIDKLNQKIADNSLEITESQADYKVLYEQAKKLGISLEGVTEDVNPSNITLLTNRLTEMVNKGIQPVDGAVAAAIPAVKELGNTAQEAGDKTRYADESFEAMTDNTKQINNLKSTIAQFVGWTGTAKALSAALRNAFQETKELDKAMTEIAVVTDFEVGDMWDQLPEYTERANSLGIAITETYEASALFYQQGLKTNEMVELSNETLKMARIAGLDASEATDRMTAALRGFNMELDQASAQKVSDVYSQLAAITASDVNEISSAMTKTASIASSAGMEFETTAAFLSQIIETTRESAETAGTAMKTVIARFQELKKSPDEIGEIEGEIVDANQIETALRSVGVSLRDAGGQFRELDEVFLELSSKWDGLDKNTQRYIATIAAGSRQQSRFIAMMQDYERTQDLVAAANNSAGASQKQYEKTMDSLETKLTRLENAWTEFSTGLMNSDLVKFAVDFLTNLLNALNKVTEGFNSFTSSLSKIGTLVAIFQMAKVVVGKFFDDIITKIYTSAHEAGQQIAQGTQDGMNSVGQVKPTPVQNNEAVSVKQALLQKIPGYTQISEGINNIKHSKDQVIAAKNKKREMSYELEGFEQESKVKVQKIKKAEESQKLKVAELKNRAPAKSSKERKKQQQELQKEEKELLKLTEERQAAEQELSDVQNENSKELAEADKKIAEAEKNSQAARKEGFNSICDGAQKAAQSLTMLGVGIGMVGQLFNSLGMEKVGAVFQNVGNIITTVGSAFMAIIPVVKLLGNTFTIQGGKIAIAGTTAQLAWWWVLIIVAAVAMLIAITAIAIKKANENSPEGKLKKAKEAADAAAESANQAAEAYDNLKNSLEELDTGYDELENLTEGTKEWYEAVKKLNGQVLTLIQNYPELAKYLTQKNGVLQLDTSGDGVQNVLSGLENNKIWTANAALSANMEVREREADLTYSNLTYKPQRYLTQEEQNLVINYNTDKANMERLGENAQLILTPEEYQKAEKLVNHTSMSTEDTTKALAKALASGDIVDAEYGLKSTLSDEELEEKYGFDSSAFDQFYLQLGEDTKALTSFGKQLNKNKEQANASYETMATAAEEMADLAGLTTDQQKQAKNLTDGGTYEAIEKEVDSKLDELNMSRKDGKGDSRDKGFYDHMTDEEKEAFNQALKNVYHDNEVTYDRESGKVTYTDADGNQQKEELHEREAKIKTQMKSIISSNRLAEHTEAAPRAIEILNEVTGTEAFSQMFQEANGGALTKGALDQIRGGDSTLNEEEITSYWEKLGEEGQKAFASFDDFKEKMVSITDTADSSLANAENIAKTIFGENNDLVKEFMTAGMAEGFANKIEEVYKISGEEGAKQIKTAYETLISGQTDEVASKITALINGVDWTNQEQLLSLQLQLEEQYDYTRKQATQLTETMAKTAKAVSNLNTTVETYGNFYHATQKVNAAIEKATNLQWEYEHILKKGANATKLVANLEQQRQAILEQGAQSLKAYEAARENQAKEYASGANIKGSNGSASDFVTFNTTTGTYDLTKLQEQINAGHFGKEGSDQRKEVDDYVNKINEANDLAKEQNDIAKEAYEQLEELNEQAEQGYQDLYDQIGDLLVSEIEKEIDTQQNILDATQSANDKLLNKMQEQIDTNRQERENDKTEKDLSDLYNQRALLMASGGSASEIADLNQQITDAEESYQDTLVDQALQNLQDANDKAIEQRERQIELQESSLEAYQQSAQYQNDIQTMLNSYMTEYQTAKEQNKDFEIKNTELGARLIEAGFLKGLDELEQAEFWDTLIGNTALAKDYLSNVKTSTENTANNTTKDGEFTLAQLLSGIERNTSQEAVADYQHQQSFRTELEKKKEHGINFTAPEEYTTNEKGKRVSQLGTLTKMNENAEAYVASEKGANSAQVKWLQNYGNKHGATLTWATKEEYYAAHADAIAKGEHKTTYGEYVQSLYNTGNANADVAMQKYKDKGAIGATTAGYNDKENAWFDLTLWGGPGQDEKKTDTKVETGKKYKGSTNLNDLWEATATDPMRKSKYKVVLLTETDGTKLYISNGSSNWYEVLDQGADLTSNEETRPSGLINYAKEFRKNNYRKYKTGGLADFTGPAWLDGTPSKPEYILNAKQTERFFSLIDVLEGYDTDKNKTSTSGDNYFDIDINVEKIDDDYDIEQIADKIRRMIYDDATYRNVNTINHIR